MSGGVVVEWMFCAAARVSAGAVLVFGMCCRILWCAYITTASPFRHERCGSSKGSESG